MDQKKFLFVSNDALIGDTAWKVIQEGHYVRYFIKNPEEKDVADGFVPKSDDWEKDVEWADIIIFDDAIEFVTRNPGRYVIKPSGQIQTNKGLLFVGEEEDGKDVIKVLDDYKRAWSKKM